jgi:exopolysaccharide biosynthesis WecB/TagA/CpsF family protein
MGLPANVQALKTNFAVIENEELEALQSHEEALIGLEESGERPIFRPENDYAPEHETRFPSFIRVKPQTPEFEEGVDCMGVPVARTSWDAIRAWFFNAAETRAREPKVMYFANAHTLNVAWSDVSFREVLKRGDVVLNDGIGVQLYSRVAGRKFAENFNGTDLMPRLFAAADPSRPIRVFLYGAAPGRAQKAARNIEARYPGVKVVGVRDGFSHASVIEEINEACADILLVGMGNPIQERWIDENKSLLDVGVVAGVGALIDFLSGEVARAPQWCRTLRIEWLYRLAREPKRLFKRYVLGNPAFLFRTALYLGAGIHPKEA